MISPRRRRFLPPDKGESTSSATCCARRPSAARSCWPRLWSRVVWANSPWQTPTTRCGTSSIGPLDLEEWAADGALALFFFLAGLELKRELAGRRRCAGPRTPPSRSSPRWPASPPPPSSTPRSTSPSDGQLRGWAIPAATDIAFALAVLAVVGASLPTSLRAFLLTLAVVDDLVAIIVIAVFFTSTLHLCRCCWRRCCWRRTRGCSTSG